MQLFIRSDAGRTLTIAVADPRAQVQELLSLVEAKQKGHRLQGYLNYGGVPLRASRSLTDYGIQNHATLDFSRRRLHVRVVTTSGPVSTSTSTITAAVLSLDQPKQIDLLMMLNVVGPSFFILNARKVRSIVRRVKLRV
ncbi:putative Ubiquitin domain-containing protein [Plasmopara halstedii]